MNEQPLTLKKMKRMKTMNRIMVLSDGETWDMAENCYSIDLTDDQLEELQDGGNIFDILENDDDEESV